jgi:hypothetical protein
MFLRTFYDRYLIKERIERFEEKLILEMDDFSNQAKTFLNMGKKSIPIKF